MSQCTLTFGEMNYRWVGGLGCWFSSTEPSGRLHKGDTRLVCGMLFKVWQKYKRWHGLSATYWWTPADEEKNRDHTGIAEFKTKLMSSVDI